MSTGISPIKSTNRHLGAIFNLYSVEIRRAVAEIYRPTNLLRKKEETEEEKEEEKEEETSRMHKELSSIEGALN